MRNPPCRMLLLSGAALFGCAAAAGAQPERVPGLLSPPGLVLAEYHTWHGLASHSKAFSDECCFANRRAYDSGDPGVIREQIRRARTMGVHGFVVDWYGPGEAGSEAARMDRNTGVLFQEAAAAGFKVALLYDQGALTTTPPEQRTARAIADLRYAESRYLGSPAYLQLANRPAVFVFQYENVDGDLRWNEIRAALAPVTLIDKDPDPGTSLVQGTRDALFDGFFGWVQAGACWDSCGTHWGQDYLDWFYDRMAQPAYAAKILVAPVWPGFDDHLAPWGKERYISRAGGAVWTGTWNQANTHGAGIALISTWNDSEEGSDIEDGLDGRTVDMEDPFPETLIRSTPVKVVWNPARGPADVQVYKHCARDPDYRRIHESGVSIDLLPGEVHEIKVWVSDPPLVKVVKVRHPDPRCAEGAAGACCPR